MAQSVNYGQLKAEIADIFNRTDLNDPNGTDIIGKAVQSLHVELVEVVGDLNMLTDDASTNALLLYQPAIYVYGSCVRVAAYMSDESMMARYTALFDPMFTDLYSGGFQEQFVVSSMGYRPYIANGITYLPPVLP